MTTQRARPAQETDDMTNGTLTTLAVLLLCAAVACVALAAWAHSWGSMAICAAWIPVHARALFLAGKASR